MAGGVTDGLRQARDHRPITGAALASDYAHTIDSDCRGVQDPIDPVSRVAKVDQAVFQ